MISKNSMKWNINLYYGLTKKRQGAHPGVEIRRLLEDLNLKHLDDDVYSGEVTDKVEAAKVLGQVLERLANPKSASTPRFLALTIHAKAD